jgi:hypothetical protein
MHTRTKSKNATWKFITKHTNNLLSHSLKYHPLS